MTSWLAKWPFLRIFNGFFLISRDFWVYGNWNLGNLGLFQLWRGFQSWGRSSDRKADLPIGRPPFRSPVLIGRSVSDRTTSFRLEGQFPIGNRFPIGNPSSNRDISKNSPQKAIVVNKSLHPPFFLPEPTIKQNFAIFYQLKISTKNNTNTPKLTRIHKKQ